MILYELKDWSQNKKYNNFWSKGSMKSLFQSDLSSKTVPITAMSAPAS